MNSKRISFVLAIVLLLHFNLCAQTILLQNVPGAFESIPESPSAVYHFTSKLKVPSGGHLQGIQGYSKNNQAQIIITGSSGHYSYYITAAPDSGAVMHKIFDAPFRHAGGCQLAGGNLFTGAEDNMEKNKSNVVMISPAETIRQTVAERRGAYKRSTAGAVGATKINEQYLVAVGDWNSEHIDFYRSMDDNFDSVATYDMSGSESWGSYQSINLITDTAQNLFMIGFCREGSTNRADLFSINNYRLSFIKARYFACRNGCSFRYGAGIRVMNESEIVIYVCQRKLKKRNSINVFGKL